MSINSNGPSVNRGPALLKGLAAGTIGGLVASWVMDRFQAVWIKASEVVPQADGDSANGSSSSTQQKQAIFG
jgi:hypothetical protein